MTLPSMPTKMPATPPRGFRIGQVQDVNLRDDARINRVVAPVQVEVEPSGW